MVDLFLYNSWHQQFLVEEMPGFLDCHQAYHHDACLQDINVIKHKTTEMPNMPSNCTSVVDTGSRELNNFLLTVKKPC